MNLPHNIPPSPLSEAELALYAFAVERADIRSD